MNNSLYLIEINRNKSLKNNENKNNNMLKYIKISNIILS